MIQQLEKRKFAFTAEANGRAWDVYYFDFKGSRGTLAFTRRVEGGWVIGILCAGELTRAQVEKKLTEEEDERAEREFFATKAG